MHINILTLYPQMFPGFLGYSLAGKALEKGIYALNVVNMRDFATDVHKTVDDSPFGGGAGMILKAEIVDKALLSLKETGPIYYLSPRGSLFNQSLAKSWSEQKTLTFICGRFEGIDQRVLDKWQVQEVSIADCVLSGGEPALLTMLDATVRLLPGVMGNADSLEEESFSHGLLEYPQYTQPQVWQDRTVPDVLISGHHAKIKAWRQAQAENLTMERRPDLYQAYLAKKLN